MKIYEQITVDITNPYPLPKMQAQQGNIGRGAKIKLVHNGALIELDKEVVNLYARLPESTEAVYLSTTVANGVITADFTNVMLSKPGAVQVEIQIIENDVEGGSQITTPIFVVEVNHSNINTGEIIASSEFNALVEALAEVQEYKANGLKGDKGDAATIQVGTVETLEPNQKATVSNSGNANDAVFNFGIPKGEKGDKGEPGAGAPKGGKTGQYLQKKTDADYDYRWADITTITTVAWDDVTGKPDAYPTAWGNVSEKPATYPSTWDTVSGKPSTFTPTPSVTKSFTLSATNWEKSYEWDKYTISDSLVTETSNQEVVPSPSINREQLKALQEANLVGTQENGKMVLWVYGTVPTIDIPITVIFRGTI